MNTTLIILRGPPASGKSTVAEELFKVAKNTVLIQQDHYRLIFKPKGLSDTGKEMIFSDTLIALNGGYSVILEGIFKMSSYQKYFEDLVRIHKSKNHMFYFDISFEETLKRNATRTVSNEFTEKDMQEWYRSKDYSRFDFEQIIPENSSLAQTFEKIKKTTNI